MNDANMITYTVMILIATVAIYFITDFFDKKEKTKKIR